MEQLDRQSLNEPYCPMSPQPKINIALLGVGTLFTATVISGFLIGYGVDVWLDTQPLFMLLFGFLGLVGGIFRVYKLLT